MQQSGLGLGAGEPLSGQLPGGSALDMAMAAQHRDVAVLRDQITTLRHEMTTMRKGSAPAHATQPSLQQVRQAEHCMASLSLPGQRGI